MLAMEEKEVKVIVNISIRMPGRTMLVREPEKAFFSRGTMSSLGISRLRNQWELRRKCPVIYT